MNHNFYTEFEKNVWYKYDPEQNWWLVGDRPDGQGNLMAFDADFKRIDECIERFKQELHGQTVVHSWY